MVLKFHHSVYWQMWEHAVDVDHGDSQSAPRLSHPWICVDVHFGCFQAKKYNFHYVSLVSKSSPENKVVVELPGGRMIKYTKNLDTLP